ncbi:ribosomal protein L22/L17, partial [Xylaria grammica]
ARASLAKPSLRSQYLLPRTQRRNAWFPNFGWGDKKPSGDGSTALSKELTMREKRSRVAERLTKRTQGATIFDDEIKESEDRYTHSEGHSDRSSMARSNAQEHMQRALNPDPRWKVRFLRKQVMKMVRTGGQLSKQERIKLTEREMRSKSTGIHTSTKKLVHLSRQIVGKTVDDAITQMRYSKKKMAREVKWQLEEAQAEAIASRGMGLGAQNGETMVPRTIKTKDGKTIEIRDPTQLYVDESWVEKGPYFGARIHYQARGRMSLMWRPLSRIHLVLKEEKTRIRQHDERVEKAAKKAPWVHLPNRPVTAQRPYYSW